MMRLRVLVADLGFERGDIFVWVLGANYEFGTLGDGWNVCTTVVYSWILRWLYILGFG
jgi:hypothetical protein